MTAAGTMIDVAAQRRRATTLDRAQHFQLLKTEPSAIVFGKTVTVFAENVGHLDGGPAHSGLRNFRERCRPAGPETGIFSSGFVAAYCSSRRRYIPRPFRGPAALQIAEKRMQMGNSQWNAHIPGVVLLAGR
jgi:hypothetical protein